MTDQLLFDFHAAGKPVPSVAGARSETVVRMLSATATDWYERGCELEETAPAQAREAYLEALKLDSQHLDAHLDLGRLLHEAHDLKGAEHHYRQALTVNPEDATAAYNLGVVLEDIGLREEAISAYSTAIEAEPGYRDAYHNAVRLYEELGDKASAVRLLKRLREFAR